MSSRWLAVLSLAVAAAATRPRYGGTLRVEVRQPYETPDPPAKGAPGLGDLNGPFTINVWEAGKRAVYAAEENAPGGRPFVDSVEVTLARPLREQSLDLDLGKAEIVQLGPVDPRRPPAGRRVWPSATVRVLALVFGARVEDARVREALALAVDRSAIHNVLLQRQGEISAALLPQWLSGYAFLFPTAPDLGRARALASAAPAAARTLTLGFADPAVRPIAERIALNARDAGLVVTVAQSGGDVRLVESRIESGDAVRALAGIAADLGLGEPARSDSPETLLAAERALLDGMRAIPLVHLPDVLGASPRVKGGPGITPLGEWRFENLWLESSKP